uniref:Ribonuclease H-like domain-containing protein n=1 Tax=Tanacetum cinerariifolium TaxID=118510 RepID=A0A6L2MQJ0_TANCI|nr:ribonuclease H-like domain-containing protein [Tanacetum cinerariifolium]
MALPDKHQLKFNSHKDAKTLMEAIEKRFGGNTKTKKDQKTLLKQEYENFTGSSSESLDQIHDRLQKLVSQLEIHRVSLSQEDVNLNTTKLVSADANVSAVCAKMPVTSLPNVDSLSNAMSMLTMRARRFLQKTGQNLGANGPTSMGFDMSKVECYNCHRKGHFAQGCRSPTDSRRNKSYDWSYQAEEEPANYALMAFHLRALLLILRFKPNDGYHDVPPPYTGTFMPPKPNLVFNIALTAVDTNHPAINVQLSTTKPDQDLSHINRSTAPIIEDWVSDSKDESETKAPQIVPSFVQSSEQVKTPRHSVKHVETTIPATTLKPTSPKPASTVVLTHSKPITITDVRPVSAIVPKIKGNPQHVLKDKGVIDSGCLRHMTRNMSYLFDFEELNGGYVAFGGNPKGGKISRKGKIRTGKLDFDDVYFVKELKFNLFSVSRMCDKKNSVLFTDTKCLILSPAFKLPDESQVLLRVLTENNMYNVNLKNIVPSGDLTCLFAKATID